MKAGIQGSDWSLHRKIFFFWFYRNRIVTFRHKFILPFRITLVNGVIDIWQKNDLLV
jgi:hypothetical protein